MKVAAYVISFCVTLFILGIGCSKEEPPPSPEKKVKVRKPIKRPVQKKAQASTTLEATKSISKTTVAKDVKTIAGEEKGPGTEETVAKEKKEIIEEEKGYYITKKGDTISMIAGKKDVYGDPLKWPILYHANRDKLDKISNSENFPDREISAGTRLKIRSPEEARENLKKRPKNYWVVNVLSSPKKERVVPNTVRLIKNGYKAYITRIKVKGKDWMRLRVGFFKSKKDADKEGKKLMAMLKLSDIWTTKVGDQELGKFGGYY